MRINPINFNYNVQKQSFKGIRVIDKKDEPIIDKMLGYKRELFDKITDEKGIDIFLFCKVTKDNGTSIPAFAGVVQEKNNRIDENGRVKSVASFKCAATSDGLIEARNKVQTAVIWANAPGNIMAMNQAESFGKTKEEKEYAAKLKDKMLSAATSHESKVWKQKLEMLLTRMSDEI